MPSRFQQRLERVGTRLDENNGESISIRRAGIVVADKTAHPILQEAEEIIPGIASTRLEYQDWGMAIDAYDFGSGPTVPVAGDIIIRTTGEEFQVVALGTDEPTFRYTTSSRTRMLVHTQRIKE